MLYVLSPAYYYKMRKHTDDDHVWAGEGGSTLADNIDV